MISLRQCIMTHFPTLQRDSSTLETGPIKRVFWVHFLILVLSVSVVRHEALVVSFWHPYGQFSNGKRFNTPMQRGKATSAIYPASCEVALTEIGFWLCTRDKLSSGSSTLGSMSWIRFWFRRNTIFYKLQSAVDIENDLKAMELIGS